MSLKHQNKDSIIMMKLYGDLNVSNVREMKKMFNILLDESMGTIGIDCGFLSGVDANGIAFFAYCASRAREKNMILVFVDLSSAIWDIIKLLGFSSGLTIMSRDIFNEQLLCNKKRFLDYRLMRLTERYRQQGGNDKIPV